MNTNENNDTAEGEPGKGRLKGLAHVDINLRVSATVTITLFVSVVSVLGVIIAAVR